AYAARRAKGRMPQARRFQSKPPWVATMWQAIGRAGLFPCKYGVADCLYGQRPALLDAVDACVGVTTCGAMPADTRCGLQRPRTEAKTYISKGATRAKRVGGAPPQRPTLRGGWGSQPCQGELGSAHGFRRPERPNDIRVCSPTRHAGHGWAARAPRLARDPAATGRCARICVL